MRKRQQLLMFIFVSIALITVTPCTQYTVHSTQRPTTVSTVQVQYICTIPRRHLQSKKKATSSPIQHANARTHYSHQKLPRLCSSVIRKLRKGTHATLFLCDCVSGLSKDTVESTAASRQCRPVPSQSDVRLERDHENPPPVGRQAVMGGVGKRPRGRMGKTRGEKKKKREPPDISIEERVCEVYTGRGYR